MACMSIRSTITIRIAEGRCGAGAISAKAVASEVLGRRKPSGPDFFRPPRGAVAPAVRVEIAYFRRPQISERPVLDRADFSGRAQREAGGYSGGG